MSDLLDIDPDVLASPEQEQEPGNGEPEPRHGDYSDATYIRLDGMRPDDFSEAERDDLLKTITTELLISYSAGVENVTMLDPEVTVIEVHEDVVDE